MKNGNDKVIMKPLGDSALIVQLGEGICPAIHEKVKNLSALLDEHPFEGFVESVPAYTNLTVHYDPVRVQYAHTNDKTSTSFEKVCFFITELMGQIGENRVSEDRTIEIPVLYGGEYGPDLDYVAEYHGLSIEEVIQIHTQNDYLVYMIGFAPGFPFMGGLDERLVTPRREKPRLAITPGSVGIGGAQTGVYTLDTPGGWQIIGRTPLDLFLPELSPPTLLQSGDKIRYVPISPEEYATYKELKK